MSAVDSQALMNILHPRHDTASIFTGLRQGGFEAGDFAQSWKFIQDDPEVFFRIGPCPACHEPPLEQSLTKRRSKGIRFLGYQAWRLKKARNARGFSANVSFDGKGVVRLIKVDQDLHLIADRRSDE